MIDTRPLILIVDDQPINLRLLAQALDASFAVKIATNGADALMLARQSPCPDAILLDVMMPGMDGYAVCAALKADAVTAAIPVIFVTAGGDARGESQALAHGAADFILKPIDPAVVRLRVGLQVQLRQREQALRESKQRLEIALEAAAMGIWDYDIATGALTWTERHAALIGLPPTRRGGTLGDLRDIVHPCDRRACLANLRRARRGGLTFDQTYRVIWPDGSRRWLHSLGKPVHDARGVALRIIGATRDISALKEHHRQLERMAHYDALTGLPNRALLTEHLRRAMARARRGGQRLALVYLDLDGFKAINDTHGHAVGDQLLIAVARRMRQALREADTLARLGGDEFAALLAELADENACQALSARLLAAASAPVSIGARHMRVTASLGIAFYPQAREIDGEQLLRQADQAMYRAKQSGKNRYHVLGNDPAD